MAWGCMPGIRCCKWSLTEAMVTPYPCASEDFSPEPRTPMNRIEGHDAVAVGDGDGEVGLGDGLVDVGLGLGFAADGHAGGGGSAGPDVSTLGASVPRPALLDTFVTADRSPSHMPR